MKSRSALYKKLLADREHLRETMVKVGGVEYGQDKIFSCEVTGDLMPEAAIGGSISHEIDVTIETFSDIPKMAYIETFFRLVHGEEVSEWMPSGVFYIDTREYDEASGLLTLHGFDGMLRAEAQWWDSSEDAGEWLPMSQQEAAEDIAQCMGVPLDPRSQIGAGLMVEYPNDLTMREVLGYIAISNAGNWSMTGDGKLLLAPLDGLPLETRFLVDDDDGGAILFGGVRIIV